MSKLNRYYRANLPLRFLLKLLFWLTRLTFVKINQYRYIATNSMLYLHEKVSVASVDNRNEKELNSNIYQKNDNDQKYKPTIVHILKPFLPFFSHVWTL